MKTLLEFPNILIGVVAAMVIHSMIILFRQDDGDDK
jgi:hypothetical protein